MIDAALLRKGRQVTANSSQSGQRDKPLCGAEFAPLGESGDAADLEILSKGEASILVDVVEDRDVNRFELLQISHGPEAEHGPLPPSTGLV